MRETSAATSGSLTLQDGTAARGARPPAGRGKFAAVKLGYMRLDVVNKNGRDMWAGERRWFFWLVVGGCPLVDFGGFLLDFLCMFASRESMLLVGYFSDIAGGEMCAREAA